MVVREAGILPCSWPGLVVVRLHLELRREAGSETEAALVPYCLHHEACSETDDFDPELQSGRVQCLQSFRGLCPSYSRILWESEALLVRHLHLGRKSWPYPEGTILPYRSHYERGSETDDVDSELHSGRVECF